VEIATTTLLLTNSRKMPPFSSKKFRPSSYNNTLPARYRAALAKHPFALFGLPFVGTMLLGSFFLTPATALRYERHDRKVKTMTEDEKLGIGKDRRRIDMKEEYYVSFIRGWHGIGMLTEMCDGRNSQRRIWTTGNRSG
jgi:cytochrome c oxidase assembly protein subunit 16